MTQNAAANALRQRSILPLTAAVNESAHLVIGGCDTLSLLQEFGSPLYVFDELTLREKCREYLAEFGDRYHDVSVLYASKAFISLAIAMIAEQEGLGLDIVSGGELAVALRAGFPMEKVYFHGNNKSAEELRAAVDAGIGRVVVDNFYELDLLNRVAGAAGRRQAVLLRISPSVDPHTHAHTTTGILDTKFGIPIETGQAEKAIAEALLAPQLELCGIHA